MANLTNNDKQVLEKLFQMSGGYVLNFSDRTIDEFFRNDIGIEIYDEKYNYYSGSKANRMRAFWRIEDDSLVGELIQKLLDYIENQILLENILKDHYPDKLINKAKEISNRLLRITEHKNSITEDEFLKREFEEISIRALQLDGTITNILEQRFDEIMKCLNSETPLAVIFLCGSTLEGILLGIAKKNTEKFNKAKSSPRDKKRKVLKYDRWTLGNFIDVAKEVGFIDEDVKKYSHSLRDFRNYIHPYEQAKQKFNPDIHTAKISWQVLKCAIIQISRKVKGNDS